MLYFLDPDPKTAANAVPKHKVRPQIEIGEQVLNPYLNKDSPLMLVRDWLWQSRDNYLWVMIYMALLIKRYNLTHKRPIKHTSLGSYCYQIRMAHTTPFTVPPNLTNLNPNHYNTIYELYKDALKKELIPKKRKTS